MTGSINSSDTDTIQELKDTIERLQLENRVHLLGFISREDQVCLIKASEAMIQPSHFEGWNTGIEDAKTLQHPVIASDIPVHREQLLEQAHYFDPNNAEDLAKKMILKPTLPHFQSYRERSLNFAKSLLKIFFNATPN
jgi:glycosyltransferase involved in cell wall biosynthesis